MYFEFSGIDISEDGFYDSAECEAQIRMFRESKRRQHCGVYERGGTIALFLPLWSKILYISCCYFRLSPPVFVPCPIGHSRMVLFTLLRREKIEVGFYSNGASLMVPRRRNGPTIQPASSSGESAFHSPTVVEQVGVNITTCPKETSRIVRKSHSCT